MIINQMSNLNEKEIRLLRNIVGHITEEGLGNISFFDSRVMAVAMGITAGNDDEIQEIFIESLLNIMGVPIMINNKNYSLYDSFVSEGNMNWVKSNDVVRKNIKDAVDYIIDYVLNPDKKTFIISEYGITQG